MRRLKSAGHTQRSPLGASNRSSGTTAAKFTHTPILSVFRREPCSNLCPGNPFTNKLTAIVDRAEPADLADVCGLRTKLGLSITRALEDADSEAAGLFPADLARSLPPADAIGQHALCLDLRIIVNA